MSIGTVCSPAQMKVDPTTGLDGADQLDATTATRRLSYASNFFGSLRIKVEMIGRLPVDFDGHGCVGRATKYIRKCADEHTSPKFFITVECDERTDSNIQLPQTKRPN